MEHHLERSGIGGYDDTDGDEDGKEWTTRI